MADHGAEMEMSLLEHLAELRQRLVRSVLVTVAAFFFCYGFHIELFNLVSAPIQEGLVSHGIYQFRAIQVTEPIMVYLKTSFVGALVVGSPYLIAQGWFFVAPGLLSSERRLALPIIFFSTAFFLLGVAFCYRIVLPVITDFLVGVGEETVTVAVDVTLDSTLSYALTFLLVFGVIFELPMVLFFITLLGLVTPKQLVDFGRYWVVLSFIIGAMVTPPDPVSQLMMAFPLVVLYGLGTATSFIAFRYVSDQEDASTDENSSGRSSIAWTSIGGGLLVLVLTAFVWLMMPRADHDALSFVDGESALILGMQPAVLAAGQRWDPLQNLISRDFPELRDLLRDTENYPEMVLYESDVEGDALLILTGQALKERLAPYVPSGCESRPEGDFLLYGTRPALRGASGRLWGCLDSLCLVGPSVRVLEKVRSSTAGLALSDDREALLTLKESGPIWGLISPSILRRLRAWDPAILPASARSATFYLRSGPQIGESLVVSLLPASGSDQDTLKLEAEGLSGFSGLKSLSGSGFYLRGSEAISQLVKLEMRVQEHSRQDPGVPRLKVPDLSALFEDGSASGQRSIALEGPWGRAFAPFVSLMKEAPSVESEENGVRLLWGAASGVGQTQVSAP